MNRVFKKALRSVTAGVLATAMAFGGAVSAFAEGTVETINYVSIGDSMANGYGFVEYAQDSNVRAEYDFINGTGMYGKGAYPLQFEEYLKEKNPDAVVNHTKLAPSAMLAEDFLYLLDGREEFDDGWGGYKSYVGTYTDAEIKPHVQKAVEEADIMTMGLGNAAFGAFFMHKVTDALGVFGATLDEDEKVNLHDALIALDLDEEQKAIIEQVGNNMRDKLLAVVPADMADQYNLEDVSDLLLYTTANFMVNYKGVIEKVLEMNPDVEIILTGLMNTTYGMEVTDDEGNVLLPIGDLMDEMFGLLNTYIAGLPTLMQADGQYPEAKFYFAAQPEPKFICQVFKEMASDEVNWGVIQDGRLSGDIIRNRNISAFNGDLAPMIGYAVTGAPLASISIEDVQAYEDIQWDVLNAYGINPWGAFMTPFNSTGIPYITTAQEATDKILSVAIYLAIEEAVAQSCDTMKIPLDGLVKIAGDLSSVFTNLGTPPTAAPELTREWLLNGLSTTETQGMCKIYGLFKVGNGMSVHPTPEGHDDIYANIVAAYENGYTAKDFTTEQLSKYWEVIVDLLKEYGPEMAEDAWQSSKENGYVPKFLIEPVDAMIEYVKNLMAQENPEAALVEDLKALKATMEAELANLTAQLNDQLKAELEALKAELADEYVALKDATDDVKASIEASIAATEHAIAVVEQTIADAEAVKAELEAEIAAVEAQIVVLEAQAAEAAASIENLYNKLVALKEAIVAFVDTADNAYDEAREELDVAIEELKKAIVATGEAVEETVEAVNAAKATAEQVVESTEKLTASVEAKVAKLVASVEAVVGEVKAAAESLKASLEALGGAAGALTEEAIAYIEARRAELEAAAAAELEALNAELMALTAMMDADILEAKANIERDRDAFVEEYEAELKLAAAPLAVLYVKLEEAVKAELPAVEAEIKAEIAVIEAEVAALEAQIESAKEAAEAELAKVEAQIKAEYEAKSAELTAKVEAIKAGIEAEIAKIKAELENGMTEAAPEIEAAKADIEKAVEEIAVLVEKIKADAPAVIAEATAKVNEAAVAIKAVAEEQYAIVCEEVAKAIEELKAYVEELKASAFVGEYIVTPESYYVSLGDSSATGYGLDGEATYTDRVAKELGLKDEQYINLGENGKLMKDYFEVIENNKEEIAKADLITVAFGSNNYSYFVASQLEYVLETGKLPVMNWEEHLTAVPCALVEKALEQAKIYLAGTDLAALNLEALGLKDITPADLVSLMVESYAYAYVDCAAHIADLVNEIHELSPEARVILVGSYNPVDELEVVFDGFELPLGELSGAVVELTNAYLTAYAALADQTTFAAIPATETIFEAENDGNEIDLRRYLLSIIRGQKAESMHASAEGHEYIKDQIINALDRTAIWGDVNSDGIVDNIDAMLTLQYFVGVVPAYNLHLAVADVDGNGTIDNIDAMMILQHFVGVIEKFPVEK